MDVCGHAVGNTEHDETGGAGIIIMTINGPHHHDCPNIG